MDLKHSPENAFQQSSCVDFFLDWYQAPQGQRVRDRLIEEIREFCSPRTGDALLEVSPVALLNGAEFNGAWAVHIGAGSRMVRADPAHLPLLRGSFDCVVLAHAGFHPSGAARLIEEAARALAPEGYLFLLEVSAGVKTWPLDMRRGRYRRWLENAGLIVRRQTTLSVLPPRLAPSWQQRLGRADALAAPWLPVLFGSCVLCVAQRRDTQPLFTRVRWRFPRLPARTAGGSQWA